jgi:DNA-binding MarR family transcriptional regulator
MEKMHPLAQIAEIAQSIRRFLKTGLASKDLTFNQYNLLQLLVENPVMNPSELADRMSINRPTVTVILRNLEKKAWIERSTDPDNRRNVQVRITGSGMQKAETVRAWMIRVKGSFDPLVELSESELETLEALLERIQTSVTRHLEALPDRLREEQSR